MLQSQPLPEETTDMPEAQASVAVEQKSESYWQFVKRQFNRNIFGRISLYLVYFLVFVAIFADFLANEKPIAASYQGRTIFPVFKEYGVMLGMTQWDKDLVLADWKTLQYDWAVFPPVPYSPETIDNSVAKLRERAPSAKHLWGTDETKRDVLAGVIHGSRYALAIGFVAMGIALAIGVVLGAIAGYYGGIVDIIISRLIELVMTFPSFLLIITVVAMVQTGSLWLIMAVIGLTGWTSIARFIRGEVLRVRNLDFVTAASALGYSTPRIIFKHVLPNALGPVLVSAAFGIASAVLVESSLSFLGIGVPPTVVTWGSILNKARTSSSSWWLGVFPGLMIFLTVSAYNLIGDALRDATDPRLRS